MRTLGIVTGAVTLLLALGACGTSNVGSSVTNPPPSGSPPPSGPDTIAPSVTITSPTTSGSYTTANASVDLSGTASDNVGVTSMTWSSAQGAGGSATGTGNWSIAGIALALGTNAITVTAHDAAGNIRNATLTVTYNPGGGSSLSGSVDSSLINRNGVNAVYVYGPAVTPDDIGSPTPPLATATVTQDNNACTFSYQLTGLAAGTYTVAFTNQAANDNPGTNDAINFVPGPQVTVTGGGGATHNFAPIGALRQVGPTRSLKKPSDAAGVAQPGDVIEIDAGEYLNDVVVWRQSNLTLRGVGGGRAYMHSTQIIPFNGTDQGNGKAIWVQSGKNMTVENIEFSGAAVPDENGAGITADGSGLTVCNGYFHDNENGILGGSGVVLVEYSEFDHNGKCPTGVNCAHNMYFAETVSKFTLRYSYSHRASIGHNVKSRAQENHILYNRIMDENDGTASYAIDIPQTGLTFIIGNLIQQGPFTDNPAIIAYGAENTNNPNHELYVINNTIVNDGPQGPFITISGGTTARFVNNLFVGPGTVPNGAGVTSTNNLATNNPGLVDRTNFNYRLTSTSVAINAGINPGTAGTVNLTPTSQYLHPTSREDRPVDGVIDIGAYEFQ